MTEFCPKCGSQLTKCEQENGIKICINCVNKQFRDLRAENKALFEENRRLKEIIKNIQNSVKYISVE